MPRPKCTQESIEIAVRLKKNGALDKDIAARLGVRPDTFSTWINHPKTENQAKLAQALKKHEAEYYASLEAIIMKAAVDKDWKAAAWLLERKRPQQYARRTGLVEEKESNAPTVPQIVDDVSGGGGWA